MNFNSNNRGKLIKRIFSLLLVALISIDTCAAVVSDNDGSAFITKAEFDSLKNSFQSQLDSYNTSIDAKIDSAIASYLQGIKVSKKETLRSTLEVAGQTYNGTKRKSYVFVGNDSPYLFCRYNYENQQFIAVTYWNVLPNLGFDYRALLSSYTKRNPSTSLSLGGLEWFGADQFQFNVSYYYRPYDSGGNPIPVSGNAIAMIVDDKNYVKGYKTNCQLLGRTIVAAQMMSQVDEIHAMPLVADATHKWKYTFKDIVGAGGTNGMGYSTRALGDNASSEFTGYKYQLFANESSSRSGWQYLNKTVRDRAGTTRYIMNYGSSTQPYQVDRNSFNVNQTASEWLDAHWHFEESRYGESYAWCMPFGHLDDKTVGCFRQWPAWEMVNWANVSTQNVGAINVSSDKIFTDVSGQHHWYQGLERARTFYYNGLSQTYFGAMTKEVADFIEFDGMLPIYKENPLRSLKLLKNNSIKNALGLDVYYAAAPALTTKFKNAGSFTWVAKVNVEDVERVPGRTWSNWGNNRIYFTSTPMNDIEYSGTNVKVSNTKKFQYKKHDTTDDWADCQSQVIDGKTYYYQTLDHNTYYDFKMDVEDNETVYYMVFDEKRPNDYYLEVIEHPDFQIDFSEKV